ncbi:hypothetical protein WR25_04422 [Diploscapter pachys]|uniref:Uncharacterized protein n=1 Tax=Diploscapter pachys TaxID=2018661 RepID=A0A2A2J8K1_9BILA|nr:hypothetical protein WR25_04422 [Diploscapter pachys]
MRNEIVCLFERKEHALENTLSRYACLKFTALEQSCSGRSAMAPIRSRERRSSSTSSSCSSSSEVNEIINILYEDSEDGNINFNDVLRIKENFGLNTSQILKKFRDRRRYVETTVMKALVQLKVTRLDDYRLDSIVQITKARFTNLGLVVSQTRKIVENTLKKFKEKIIEKISKTESERTKDVVKYADESESLKGSIGDDAEGHMG